MYSSETQHLIWITGYVARCYQQYGEMGVVGRCEEACDEMRKTFPELKKVRGHVLHLGDVDSWPHWWLVAEDGTIVDPTASQFQQPTYFPWDESQKEPTGKCPNCGGYCYDFRSLCSDECESSYLSYLSNPLAYQNGW